MGWTYMPQPTSTREELQRMLNFESETRTHECLDLSIVNFREAYAACKVTHTDTDESHVYCAIFLLDYRPHDPFGFGYKDMDETMGTGLFNCPERILNLLTDIGSEAAAKWRAECRRRIAERKAKPRLKTGSWLILDTPMGFVDGRSRDVFRIVNARRRIFEDRRGTRCRLPRDLGSYRVIKTYDGVA